MNAQEIMKGTTVTTMWGAISYISSIEVVYGSLLAFCGIVVTALVAIGMLAKNNAERSDG